MTSSDEMRRLGPRWFIGLGLIELTDKSADGTEFGFDESIWDFSRRRIHAIDKLLIHYRVGNEESVPGFLVIGMASISLASKAC